MDTDAAPKKRRKREKAVQKTTQERVVEAYARARKHAAKRSAREAGGDGAGGAGDQPGPEQASLSLPDAQTLLRRHEEVNRETEARQGVAARRAKAAVNAMLLGPAADADRASEGADGEDSAEAPPAAEEAEQWDLHPSLIAATRSSAIARFFPIQRRVVPAVLRADARSATLGGDVCITAPTGSGKTLAYALPILHALAGRRVVRLRALVLLPTRDLAQQVRRVFAQWAAGTDLRIGLAVGRSSLAREQANLVEVAENSPLHAGASAAEPSAWSLLREGFRPSATATAADGSEAARSRVDILIATPGRLADHLLHTPGFTLRHLRFLVVDEADRLLADRYSVRWPPCLRLALALTHALCRCLRRAGSTACTPQRTRTRDPPRRGSAQARCPSPPCDGARTQHEEETRTPFTSARGRARGSRRRAQCWTAPRWRR